MKNKENTIFIMFVICILESVFIILGVIDFEIKQATIDHKCFEMYNEEFYLNEMCEEYWNER